MPSPSASPPLPHGLKSSRSWSAERPFIGEEMLHSLQGACSLLVLIGPGGHASGLLYCCTSCELDCVLLIPLCVFTCQSVLIYDCLEGMKSRRKDREKRQQQQSVHCTAASWTQLKWTNPTLAISLMYGYCFLPLNWPFSEKKLPSASSGNNLNCVVLSKPLMMSRQSQTYLVWWASDDVCTSKHLCLCHTGTIPLFSLCLFICICTSTSALRKTQPHQFRQGGNGNDNLKHYLKVIL